MSLDEQPAMIQQHHEPDLSLAPSVMGLAPPTESLPAPLYNLATNSSSSERPEEEEEVDPQIIEALKSKDRIYVLKLGEVMESLIREGRMRADTSPVTSYQRLLVHRCSAYYRLQPEADLTTKGISVRTTPESRIPPRRICELVPAEQMTQPAFQIMRRLTNSKAQSSRAGSDAGDLSDSETGSMASSKKRSNRTIEEREAAYNEARSRIFMNFEQKEKDSASSSTLSLVSTRDSGSLDDDSISTPATESERSGPAIHVNTQDKRRNASSNGGSSSKRPGRDKPMSNGHNSSRGSRAASPSYAVYEPPPQMIGHDPVMQARYPATYYYYPPPPAGYVPPPMYGIYPHYPPYQPPPPPHPSGEAFTPPAQPHPYPYPYPWPPHPHSTPTSPPPGAQPLPPSQQNGYSYMSPPYGYPVHPPQPYYTPPMVSSPDLAPFEEPTLWSPNDPIPPRRQRKGGTWSYGPGIGQHGEAVGTTGPRFNTNIRRTSNRSVNGDEESSTSSSTTSSHSSRRTYTSSTTSSQHHPLPARPDWAVGLKPQPSHRHHNGHPSPARKQQQPPLPTDFPPLTPSSSAVQKPVATPAGAWTNARSILKPPRSDKDVAEGLQDLSLGQ